LRLNQWILISLVWILAPGLRAATPVIRSVRNFASGDARFSPGVLVELTFSPLNAFQPDTDQVQIGGVVVPAYDEETGDAVIVRVPASFPQGSTNVVLVTSGSTSAPFPIRLDAYAPGIFSPVASQNFEWGLPYFACNRTSTAGDVVTLFAVGLGSLSSTGATPAITVGGKAVELVDSTPVTIVPRLGADIGQAYRFQFRVPAGDGMHAVVLSIAGTQSNVVSLPVGTAVRNLSAPTFTERYTAAPESLQTAFRCNNTDFAARFGIVSNFPDIPTSLAGVSVDVRDSAGMERLAPLYGLTWEQVNYVVPPGTASGPATVTVFANGRAVGETDLVITDVAPDLFQVSQLVRGQSVQFIGPSMPIDLRGGEAYLVLYGTGLRLRSSLASVSATIGGVTVPVEYAGRQPDQLGLDQVNLRLPQSLAGVGNALLDLVVDGRHANLWLNFQ
jgi:uncharacterized protein (TIGR03437 family)